METPAQNEAARGILICGLNGTGKSTFGRAFAEQRRRHFIDMEDMYFPKTDPRYCYASPRTGAQARALLLREIETHREFVLASVDGAYGEAFCASLEAAILLRVPRELRMQRVRARSFAKFGSRMLPGGDLYETEERFFQAVEARAENAVEEWAKTLSCPVLCLDGTKPVAENLTRLSRMLP